MATSSGEGSRRTRYQDQIDRHRNQFGRELVVASVRTFRGAVFNNEVLALDIAQLPELFPETLDRLKRQICH